MLQRHFRQIFWVICHKLQRRDSNTHNAVYEAAQVLSWHSAMWIWHESDHKDKCYPSLEEEIRTPGPVIPNHVRCHYATSSLFRSFDWMQTADCIMPFVWGGRDPGHAVGNQIFICGMPSLVWHFSYSQMEETSFFRFLRPAVGMNGHAPSSYGYQPYALLIKLHSDSTVSQALRLSSPPLTIFLYRIGRMPFFLTFLRSWIGNGGNCPFSYFNDIFHTVRKKAVTLYLCTAHAVCFFRELQSAAILNTAGACTKHHWYKDQYSRDSVLLCTVYVSSSGLLTSSIIAYNAVALQVF